MSAARVPRHIAKELIQFIKKVNVRANFWDPKAKSAFEFSRQMSSPKLKKINTTYSCTLTTYHTDEPPTVEAEFLDGTKLSLSSLDKTCAELRSVIYEKAGEAEETMEKTGAAPGGKQSTADAGAKGGAGKKK